MTEYIERKALRDTLYDADAITMNGVKILNQFPASDVAPIRHGRWEQVIPSKSAAKWSNKVSCSVCHSAGYKRFNYCPNCGAKMDLEVLIDG